MDKKVKIYSTPSCPYCIKAKQFLKENNINFEDIDITQNQARAEEMIQKTGQIGVPVLDIDGEIIVGFNKAAISKSLSL